MVIILENIELVAVSFLASFGLGFVFHIQKKDLVWAGVGGALTRCAVIVMPEVTDFVFLQSLAAAVVAALFAEIMAMRRRSPSTVFLYPAIIPLIPGGTIYYVAMYLLMEDEVHALAYTSECVQALCGICIGFVAVSTFTYYKRLYYMGEHIEGKLKGWLKKLLTGKG